MSVFRTFVAIEAPSEICHRAAALIARLKSSGAKVRWADTTAMHWTLSFLGDVPDNGIAGVCRCVTEAVTPFSPFEVDVCGCGAFLSSGRPRTLWLGVGEGSKALVELQAAIEQSLAGLGFRAEARQYKPHLTLGRVRDASTGLEELAELVQQHADFSAGLMAVDEVVVFSSQLERTGAVHTPLGHAPLAAPRAERRW